MKYSFFAGGEEWESDIGWKESWWRNWLSPMIVRTPRALILMIFLQNKCHYFVPIHNSRIQKDPQDHSFPTVQLIFKFSFSIISSTLVPWDLTVNICFMLKFKTNPSYLSPLPLARSRTFEGCKWERADKSIVSMGFSFESVSPFSNQFFLFVVSFNRSKLPFSFNF